MDPDEDGDVLSKRCTTGSLVFPVIDAASADAEIPPPDDRCTVRGGGAAAGEALVCAAGDRRTRSRVPRAGGRPPRPVQVPSVSSAPSANLPEGGRRHAARERQVVDPLVGERRVGGVGGDVPGVVDVELVAAALAGKFVRLARAGGGQRRAAERACDRGDEAKAHEQVLGARQTHGRWNRGASPRSSEPAQPQP